MAAALAVIAGWYATRPGTIAPRLRSIESRVNPIDGLTYVKIPPGKFMMGCSPGDDLCGEDEKPRHEVTLTRAFWMGQTEVTVGAYERFTTGKGSNISLPAVRVEFEDAKRYCDWAGLRLPTEAEWEYAARANTGGPLYGELDEVGWYRGNSDDHVHPVGGKKPNAWGLYDMLGNVWEWVADWYGRYDGNAVINPAGPSSGPYHGLRGGSWYNSSGFARASFANGTACPLSARLSAFGVLENCIDPVPGQGAISEWLASVGDYT